ncbi:MAG: hypothetical protein ACREIF_11945 [Chthoniobacterales bacterium]
MAPPRASHFLLVLFVVTPIVAIFHPGVLIMNVIAAVLVTAAYGLTERRRLFAGAVVLSGISIVATWLLLIAQQTWAAALSHSLVIVLIIYFPITILGDVLRGARITVGKIFAAVCVYLLTTAAR